VKAWLSRAGVPFVERNIEEDDTAYDELLALQFRTVPVIVAGERRVKGYDEAALAALAEAWRQGHVHD
jgi:glutaredoxin